MFHFDVETRTQNSEIIFLCQPTEPTHRTLTRTHVIRGVADPGEVDVEVVGEGLEHVDLDLVLLSVAVEPILPGNVTEDGVRLGNLEVA